MRILVYAPIVHSEADMGSLLKGVKQGFVSAFGENEWARRAAAVEAMWEGLAARLAAMPLVWSQVRLYQDGLPVCGREMDIVRDVAAQGSKNHRLLLHLVEQGATLMGTEDPQLMIREYRRIQALARAAIEAVPDSEIEALRREGDASLIARDAFIAKRIEETLQEGETGIAFLGMLHRVNEQLTDGVQVKYLIHSLPFGSNQYKRSENSDHEKRPEKE